MCDAGLFTKANKYMGFPTKETDTAWDDLYNCKLVSSQYHQYVCA